ncbi:efflux RND transporter periplasmic adaptor subunit [Modicisalibacter tunisiensis]|uniref:efflux RND transporter periplasmic adaptor subunit n=1 Tax=Modicisalibacter TaxID=574347 RepID=UPI0013D70ECC|nr:MULTISPECIES: efflux RND transporter periplasmic adaptor subunit [Modicisalibacter]MBZ9537350.1 efflux RND transporter periplasmic adaptor subunit [Modicisalibacter tunisiensis]
MKPEFPSPGCAPARQDGRLAPGALLSLGVLLLAGAVAYWLLSHPPRTGQRAAPPEPAPPTVSVASIQRRNVAPTLVAYGRVIAARETRVASRVAGQLERFAPGVEPGRVVETGATLAILDDADYRLAVQRAEAALTRARADLAIERGQQLQAQADYRTYGRELPAERRALVLREPQLKAARAAVSSAEADLEQARLELARTTIAAPFRGMVQERLVGAGSAVAANTALLGLVDVSHFWVRVSLESDALDWLETGDGIDSGSLATLVSDAWPADRQRRGRAFSILPGLAENGLMSQLLVRVEDPLALDTKAPALRLGDVVEARFTPPGRDDLIGLPVAALHEDDRVWTLDAGNRLHIVSVTPFYRDQRQVLIRADGAPLGGAERVVVSPLVRPREGMALRVAPTPDDTSPGGDADDGETPP